MRILAIIPARGGSKGIPRKNLLLIGGRPLLAHSIIQAKAAPDITRIVVSTDDEEIDSISREWGAEVIHRPRDISGDTASSESALAHALDLLKQKENYVPDLVVFLQATSPCRAPGEVQRAIDALIKEDADSLFSVGPVHGFVWRIEVDGALRSFSYNHLNRPRRQDAPEDLIENGSIYVFKPWVLRKFNNRLGGKIALHRMSALDSFQIDEAGDFELLEILMRHRGVFGSTAQPKPGGQKGGGNIGQWSHIRLLVLDFDGVLTDNRVVVSESGVESVICSREDGLGLERLRKSGVQSLVISKESNPVVSARCRKLGVECIQSCEDKLAALQKWSIGRDLNSDQIAYVGNDLNDLECLRWAGLPIAVSDGAPEVLAVANYTTNKSGGHGAVREVCEMLLRSQHSH